MPERVANLFVLCFLTLFGLCWVGTAVWAMYTSSVLEKRGITQPGRIVQIEEVDGTLSFRVRFTYQQHPYDIYNRVHDNDPLYRLHDAVEVLFLPNQPEEAIINSEKEKYQGYVLFLLIGFSIASVWPTIQYVKWYQAP